MDAQIEYPFLFNLLLDGKSDIVVCSSGDKLRTLSIDECVREEAIPDLEKLKILKQLKTVV